MDFRLDDDQVMLADTVSALLRDTCSGADLRRLLASNAPLDVERWRAMAEMGLPGAMAPLDAGGAGLGAVEMALIAQAAGHAALPEPLVDHAGVAVPLLAKAGLLSAAILTDQIVAVADPATGLVAGADAAHWLLLWDDKDAVLVAAAEVRLDRREGFDALRRLFAVDNAKGAGRRLPGTAHQARTNGALFAAAQLVGTAQRAVEMAVAYTSERQQFGKPIGSFQAVKHQLADAQVGIEFARPLVLAAAAMLDTGSPLDAMRVSHAKIAAAAAADRAVHAALQVHGAMGYSWEVDIHFLLKRSLALGNAWGTPEWHKARVADFALSQLLGADRTFGDPFAEQMEVIHESA